MHQAGASALSQLLQCEPPGKEDCQIPCNCGYKAHYREMRSRRLLTVVGEVSLLRPWYLCAHCHNGQFPVDVMLDIDKTDLSPGVRRMLALVGSEVPFDHGRKQIKLLAGLPVTTKAVERTAESIGADIAGRERAAIERTAQLHLLIVVGDPIPILYVQMDGTGIPVVKKETAGRAGKVEGQPVHTREVKLGCVFTQITWDEHGYAIREPESTTYTGAIESSHKFGLRIYLEAWNRGSARAQKKVVIGDGAEWIWNNADQHFPGAIQIVDFCHTREHLWTVAHLIHPGDVARQKQWMMRHQPKLDEGKIEKLVRFLRTIDPSNPALAKAIRVEAAYFERNADRMRYPEFRRQHLFVGSGVIEAACKTVIGARLKQSGMFWTVDNANAIIALRCCQLNNRMENYWENRRAA